MSAIIFFYMHGAATRVASADTAFAPRRPLWDVDLVGQWASAGESADHIAWVKSVWSRMEPHLLGTAYVNHLSADDRPEKVRASFGENYGRLRQVKGVDRPDERIPDERQHRAVTPPQGGSPYNPRYAFASHLRHSPRPV